MHAKGFRRHRQRIQPPVLRPCELVLQPCLRLREPGRRSGPILLKDVATVFFDLKEEESFSRVNGMESISITLINDAQSNLIDLSHRTISVVNQLTNACSLWN